MKSPLYCFQLVATLASAELSMQFEHRDLHWGNILIEKIEDKNKNLYILVDDAEYEISSCGLVVTIIDFTLARLLSGMILSVHSVIIRLY